MIRPSPTPSATPPPRRLPQAACQACQGGEGRGGAGEIPSGGRGHNHGARHSYLTPTSPADKRAPGILTESCFNKRPDARPHDAANRCEFIVADYYLLECLLVLAGELDPTAV